jgi:mono/diheme cytochrome c family protein
MKNGLIVALIVLGAAAVLLLLQLSTAPPPPSEETAQAPTPQFTEPQAPLEELQAQPPSNPAPEPQIALPTEQVEQAKSILLRLGCGSCHTLRAAGLNLVGQVGPDLTYEGRRGRSAEWLRRQLLDPTSIPDEEVAPGFEGMQPLMPSYGRLLTEEELGVLIAFLQALK